jgi:hypothetical protein
MASTVRKEVNSSICMGIHDRMSAVERAGLLRLLEERDSDGSTQYNRLKKSAQSPTWSHFKRLITHLEWVDALGDTGVWMGGVAARKVTDFARTADAGYPDNESLVIDPATGIPSLKAHRSEGQRPSAKRLEQEIKARMPERTLIGICARTAYWVEWWRRFGPPSGNDPKLADPSGRYVLTTFCARLVTVHIPCVRDRDGMAGAPHPPRSSPAGLSAAVFARAA